MNYDEFVAKETGFLKRVGNIYITDGQIEVLKKYGFNINNYKTISELIFDIENMINNSIQNLDELDYISSELSELNYYNNTNK